MRRKKFLGRKSHRVVWHLEFEIPGKGSGRILKNRCRSCYCNILMRHQRAELQHGFERSGPSFYPYPGNLLDLAHVDLRGREGHHGAQVQATIRASEPSPAPATEHYSGQERRDNRVEESHGVRTQHSLSGTHKIWLRFLHLT